MEVLDGTVEVLDERTSMAWAWDMDMVKAVVVGVADAFVECRASW